MSVIGFEPNFETVRNVSIATVIVAIFSLVFLKMVSEPHYESDDE